MKFEILTLKNPVIDVNYKEISEKLQQKMAEYEGLIVTKDTLSGAIKTKSELRKIRKEIDDYRKKIKKELTEPIKNFENNCKNLISIIDKQLEPIDLGITHFVNIEKEEKRKKILNVIAEIEKEYELGGAYTLGISDRYLNKSVTLKSIKDNLIGQALNLQTLRKSYRKGIEGIKEHIETLNTKYDINPEMELSDFDVPDPAKVYLDFIPIYQEITKQAEKLNLIKTRAIEQEKQREEQKKIAKQEEKKQQEELEENLEKEEGKTIYNPFEHYVNEVYKKPKPVWDELYDERPHVREISLHIKEKDFEELVLWLDDKKIVWEELEDL